MKRHLCLAAYDVVEPRRLARARHAVTAWAHGGQRSVVECWIARGERRDLLIGMTAPLRLERDRLALLPISRADRVFALGRARTPHDAALVYIG